MQSTYSFFSKFCFFGLLCALLAGCSFHLRDDYNVPEQLNTLSLTSYDKYSALSRLVKNQLRMSEVKIVEPAETIPNLHLVSESLSERTLSVYQNTRTAEYELTLQVTYRVTIPDMEEKTFTTSVTRSYLDNPLTALAKSMERSMIVEEMRKMTSQQIIRQMARLKSDFAAHSNGTLKTKHPSGHEKTSDSTTTIRQ